MRITMGKKEEYKEKNLRFLEEVATGEGVVKLPCGVLYKEIEKGTGVVSPELTDVVSVHYRGTLANGREFDNSWKRGCPEAFRLNQVIKGWQEVLRRMHVGDRWMIYIVYIRLRDTYIRSDPRLFHTAVRSRTVGDCIIFLKALF
jgi:peptidylprolyl isomerase